MNIKHMDQDEIDYWMEHGSHKSKWCSIIMVLSVLAWSASIAAMVLTIFEVR